MNGNEGLFEDRLICRRPVRGEWLTVKIQVSSGKPLFAFEGPRHGPSAPPREVWIRRIEIERFLRTSGTNCAYPEINKAPLHGSAVLRAPVPRIDALHR